MSNVARPEQFQQVCVWPGTLMGDFTPEKFVRWMHREFSTRVWFLEEILTHPGKGGDGGRNDLFFAVHNDDVGGFAVPRLMAGIRWIEDAIAEINGGGVLYPERVGAYRTWNTEDAPQA